MGVPRTSLRRKSLILRLGMDSFFSVSTSNNSICDMRGRVCVCGVGDFIKYVSVRSLDRLDPIGCTLPGSRDPSHDHTRTSS